MSSTLSAIRAGLVSNITSNVSGIEVFTGYLVSPLQPPCFEIDFPADSFTFSYTMGDTSHELQLIVRGIVDVNDPQSGQALLDTWLDSGGVKDAIESDRTLGGAVDNLRVTQATGHRRLLSAEQPNALFLCAEWTVYLILNDELQTTGPSSSSSAS